MATVYNSQLDAFELYHRVQERNNGTSKSAGGSALAALGDGIAGSAGAAISNIATYPLDLIITRLQIQRQLRKDQSTPSDEEYNGLQDAAEKIYNNEGGISGFYTGVLQDTGKTIADSFFFFLAYNYFRQKRLAANGGSKSLPALEELGVGFVAGSLTKLLTTPIANIVTRKQAAALTASRAQASSPTGPDSDQKAAQSYPSSTQIVHDIMSEQGMSGFWSGYSASLVLTLNPSLTFFLFETLKRVLLPRSKRENPPAAATFLIAAISKACASSVTYPFSLAKARAQSGTHSSEDAAAEKNAVGDATKSSSARKAARHTIFSSLIAIARAEGIPALYEGLPLEITKSFFSHGITMLVKQALQRLLTQAYYMLSIIVNRYRHKNTSPLVLAQRARGKSVEYYDLAVKRANEKVEEAQRLIKQKANETAEFVAEYVEEEDGEGGGSAEWRDLYGTGLAKWLDQGKWK